jgi:hypothetical protein
MNIITLEHRTSGECWYRVGYERADGTRVLGEPQYGGVGVAGLGTAQDFALENARARFGDGYKLVEVATAGTNEEPTAGKWCVVPSSNNRNGFGWRDIVAMGGAYSPAYVGEALARDAHLFAAAKDMYDALSDALSELEGITSGDPDHRCSDLLWRMSVALMKARGVS